MPRPPTTLEERCAARWRRDDWESTEDTRQRRREKLIGMGFSVRAARERQGIAAAYLEDRSPRFRGLPFKTTKHGSSVPAYSNPKSGRKRRREPKTHLPRFATNYGQC